MSNPIEEVEDWLYSDDRDLDPPIDAIEALLEHARKSDTYIRKIYQAIGWMYRDACRTMETGLTDTYRGLPLDHVFGRVNDSLELPAPLEMDPDLGPEADDLAANDAPVIQLVN